VSLPPCFPTLSSTHQPQIGANYSWSIDPRGPGRRPEYKRHQNAPLAALPMPGAECCAQYHTTISQNLHTISQNLHTVCAGEGVRAQSLIYSQQRTHHFCRHHPAFNAYATISRHQNISTHRKSYYRHNTVHETDKSTFLVPLSIIKVLLWYLFSPSYFSENTCKLHCHHDKNHVNCTVITQYVRIALLSMSFMTNTLWSPWARGGDHSRAADTKGKLGVEYRA